MVNGQKGTELRAERGCDDGAATSPWAVADTEKLFEAALAAHRGGDLVTAERFYRQILDMAPHHPGAWHFLGVIALAKGDLREACQAIEYSLQFCSQKAVYWNNYGAVLKALGRWSEAAAAFSRAIDLRADYADAWSNLGLVHLERGEAVDAERCLLRALELAPHHVDALRHLARLRQIQGNSRESLRLCELALALPPRHAELLLQLGELYATLKRFREAIRVLREAVNLRPTWGQAHLALGQVLNDLEEYEKAREAFRRAAQLCPKRPLWRWRELSLCPAVFDSEEALWAYRAELERRLDEALTERLPVDWREIFQDGFVPSFHLYHHGVCDRGLREKFAALWGEAFPQERPQAPRGSKIRVGFLVTAGHHGGFLRGLGRVLTGLDRRRFEVVGLVSAGIGETCRKSVPAGDIPWIEFPHEIQQALSVIRQVQCHIIFHWQAGTDAVDYFLPFLPLAPVQCIGFGQHGTTGIKNIDYFISSQLFERGAEAQEDYTEKLVQFSGLTTWQPRPQIPLGVSRKEWALPEEGTIYFCPHRLSKFHPAFDRLLRGVLEADEEGYLVVLKGYRPATQARLQARWESTLGKDLCRRVIWLPSQSVGDYYRLLSAADVVLDSPAYSGSLTGFDALGLGIPVATLPGRLMVQRYMDGFYRLLDLPELIATTEEEYIRLAVRLGRERDFHQAMRKKISERAEVLFEQDGVIREYEDLFTQLREHSH